MADVVSFSTVAMAFERRSQWYLEGSKKSIPFNGRWFLSNGYGKDVLFFNFQEVGINGSRRWVK